MLKRIALLFPFAGCAAGLYAQALQPPVLDTLFDPGQGALRLAVGALGASFVDSPIDAGMPLALAETSAAGRYMLVVNAADQSVSILRSSAGHFTSSPVNVDSAPARIALSATGQAAILYYPASKSLVALTGLPDSPTILRTASLDAPGRLHRLAISDDGEVIAASIYASGVQDGSAESSAQPERSSGFYLTYSGVIQNTAELSGVTALSFVPRSRDFLVADNHGSRVSRVSAGSDGPVISPVATPEQKVVGLGVSTDNARAFAVSNAGEVLELDSSKNQFQVTANCACKPEGMFGISGNARFRLNKLPASPIWVFDGDSVPSRVAFIPVAGQATSIQGKEN